MAVCLSGASTRATAAATTVLPSASERQEGPAPWVPTRVQEASYSFASGALSAQVYAAVASPPVGRVHGWICTPAACMRLASIASPGTASVAGTDGGTSALSWSQTRAAASVEVSVEVAGATKQAPTATTSTNAADTRMAFDGFGSIAHLLGAESRDL